MKNISTTTCIRFHWVCNEAIKGVLCNEKVKSIATKSSELVQACWSEDGMSIESGDYAIVAAFSEQNPEDRTQKQVPSTIYLP